MNEYGAQSLPQDEQRGLSDSSSSLAEVTIGRLEHVDDSIIEALQEPHRSDGGSSRPAITQCGLVGEWSKERCKQSS
jgi:hypothetical protein